MSRVQELLDKAVRKCSQPTYMALAERIGVSRASLSQFKLGLVPMPEERITQVAKIAGEDPDLWLLVVKAEQTHGEAGKAWARLARRLGAAAAVFLMLFTVALPTPASVRMLRSPNLNDAQLYTLCEITDEGDPVPSGAFPR